MRSALPIQSGSARETPSRSRVGNRCSRGPGRSRPGLLHSRGGGRAERDRRHGLAESSIDLRRRSDPVTGPRPRGCAGARHATLPPCHGASQPSGTREVPFGGDRGWVLPGRCGDASGPFAAHRIEAAGVDGRTAPRRSCQPAEPMACGSRGGGGSRSRPPSARAAIAGVARRGAFPVWTGALPEQRPSVDPRKPCRASAAFNC